MSEPTEADRLARATRTGLSWSFLGAVVTNVIRVAMVAVLGRVLDSRDFGIVAAAISVNVLFYSVRDLGIGRALVQLKDVDRAHLQTAFAVSTYLGLVISGALALTAPLIADLYRIPAATNVIRVLGLLFVLRGVAITSRMQCQRAMRFRFIALIDQASFALGSGVSVVLAVAGAGPWALAIGYLVEEGTSTLGYLVASPPPYAIRFSVAKLRDLMRFGTGETVSQVVATLATYGDNFVVGHALGSSMLGYYTRAYDLIKFPSTVFDMIAGNVLFPVFSRFQDDADRLAAGLRRATFVNGLILLPASTLLLIAAPEAIRLLMGPGWDESVLPFRVLALTILMRTGWKVGALVASAAGRIQGVAIVNTVYMICVIGGALGSVHWGIVGVAASTAVAIAVTYVGTTYLALQVSGLSALAVLKAHVPGMFLASFVVVVAYPLTTFLRGLMHPIAILGLSTAAAIGVSLVAVLLGTRSGRGDFGWLAEEIARVRRRARPAGVTGA